MDITAMISVQALYSSPVHIPLSCTLARYQDCIIAALWDWPVVILSPGMHRQPNVSDTGKLAPCATMQVKLGYVYHCEE